MAYQRPMVTVDQNMTVAPTSIEREQPAFIFGPNYELYRYEYADEKKKTQIQSYTGTEFVAEYPAAIDPEAVDNSFTKLFGDNVVVELAELEGVTLAEKAENLTGTDEQKKKETEAELTSEKGGYSRLFFKDKVYVDRDAKGKRYELDGKIVKNIAVGDQLIVNYTKYGNEASIRTTVTSAQYSTEGFDLTMKFTGLEITGSGTLIEIDDAIPTGSDVSVTSVSLVDVLNGVEFDSKKGDDAGTYYWTTSDDGFGVKESIPFGTPVEVGTATYADKKLTFTGTLGTTLAKGDTVKLSWTSAGSETVTATATVVSVDEKVVSVDVTFGAGVSAPGASDNVTVNKTATTSEKKVYGVKVFDGLKAADVAYSSDYETLYDVISADLFVSHRELLTTYADTLHSLVGASSVSNMLGKVDPDNPLAMGVYMAALNSATDDGDEAPAVYYMATPTDDVDGYTAVLNKASLTDKVYVLAPATRDEAVIELVRNHVLEMSAKTVKQWRIAAVSAEIPDTVCRLDSSMDVNGDHFYAIPVSASGMAPNNGFSYNMFRIVKDSSSSDGNTDTKLRSTVVKGDTVKFAFRTDSYGELKSDTYTVKRVINNYTIEVEESIDVFGLDGKDNDGKDRAFYVPERIEIYHTYTSAEHAEAIASTSSALASRRVMNVFPSVFKMDGVQMTGEFAACAVAGLVSATEPQQPITNVTVRGIDDIPLVYQTYNNTELDTIAAGGTFIVTQDLPGDTVYVRHQITTAYPDGNLNTAELSITKNVDSISYAFADLFKPYYGKYNITNELLQIFENLAGQLINQFGSDTSVYGPQLITDETKINYVKQNELMKDHVDISITLGVPYPCNNIDIVLTV